MHLERPDLRLGCMRAGCHVSEYLKLHVLFPSFAELLLLGTILCPVGERDNIKIVLRTYRDVYTQAPLLAGAYPRDQHHPATLLVPHVPAQPCVPVPL